MDNIFTFLLSKESLPRFWAWVFLLLEVSINAIPYWTGRARADGDRKYRITFTWLKGQHEGKRKSLKVDLGGLMVHARKRSIALIDVERLSTSILEYVSIGSDLLAAAFVFDITSVIVFIASPTIPRTELGRPLAAFPAHLIALLLIVFAQSGERKWWRTALHNLTGVFAVLLAFIILASLIE